MPGFNLGERMRSRIEWPTDGMAAIDAGASPCDHDRDHHEQQAGHQ